MIERMQQLAADWVQNGDRRAVFLGCYSLMTRNMLRAIEREEFEDNAWVAELLAHFAGYYFSALEAFEMLNAVPGCWQTAFETARRAESNVLQDLFLGVNAHINYDLVLTLADVLQPEWAVLTDNQRSLRYRDHCRVNKVIRDTVDQVQDEIVEKADGRMQALDLLMGPVDEWLTGWLITHWREQVWQEALVLLELTSATERELFLKDLETRTQQQAHKILGRR